MERKEAIEIIKKNWPDNSFTMLQEALETLIPELKESESERIRKALINYFSDFHLQTFAGLNPKEILTWLEKQEEQNNEDVDILQRFSFYSYKDEPNVLYLSNVYVNEEYRNKGIGTRILEVADEVAKSLNCHAIRLKTKKNSDAERLYQTHGYNSLSTEGKDEIWLEKQEIKEHNTCSICDFCAEQYGCVSPCSIKLTEEQKSAEWSKEDELQVQGIINLLPGLTNRHNWLKSLKDRIQPQQEWSEEDESMRTRCVGILGRCYMGELPTKVEEELNWLKSLKSQKQWKPSDKEMEALSNALGLAKNCGEESAFDLRTLYEQLKKLREE